MKLFGNKVEASYIETLVIPRGEQQYVFRMRPLTKDDDEEFDRLCPRPIPTTWTLPGGGTETDTNSKEYLENMLKYRKYRSDFLMLKSLDATEGLEWESVKTEDIASWGNIDDELRDSGFLDTEIIMLFNKIIEVNGLSSDKIEKATKTFLATQARQTN
jgi:hypothetical protein